MRRPSLVMLVLVLALLSCLGMACRESSSGEGPAQSEYWPTQGWRSSTPEEQGVSSAALLDMLDQVERQQLALHSLLVVRNGYLLAEVYFNPYSPDRAAPVASVTKSVTSALLGIAIDKGLIEDEQQPVLTFFPDRTVANPDERKSALTLAHLLSMSAGFDYQETSGGVEQSDDWVSYMLDRPMAAAPGTTFNYCSGVSHLLSAVLAKATGQTPRVFANEHLFGPLGIAPVPEEHWMTDPQGLSFGGAGLSLTPRDMAKIGYLYLKGGSWDGRQVISSRWVSASTSLHIMKDDGYGEGYLWSLDTKQKSFMALGAAGQQIHVLPEKQLVVVMTAGLTPGHNRDFVPLKALFDNYLVPAVRSDHALASDPAAYARLKERTRKAISPLQPVPPLPATARQANGVIYKLAENAFGWHTIGFEFGEGEAQATVVVDGASIDPPIGLDNLYRVGQAENGVQTCLRGGWEKDGTFVIRQLNLGDLSGFTHRVRFEGDRITITTTPSMGGEDIRIEGVRQAAGS